MLWLCMVPMRASSVQDSLVVDGIRFDYVSDVNIDSLLVDNPFLKTHGSGGWVRVGRSTPLPRTRRSIG